ncbi:hypothetical protein [Coleofasciculus sp. H7-2]
MVRCHREWEAIASSPLNDAAVAWKLHGHKQTSLFAGRIEPPCNIEP